MIDYIRSMQMQDWSAWCGGMIAFVKSPEFLAAGGEIVRTNHGCRIWLNTGVFGPSMAMHCDLCPRFPLSVCISAMAPKPETFEFAGSRNAS